MDTLDKKTKKQSIGLIGENKAIVFLKKKGFKILTRNFKAKGFEIDIIARKYNLLYFFEVKTSICYQKKDFEKILPLEHINNKKIRSLYKGIRYFLKQKNLDPDETSWKIIFLEVTFFEKNKEPKINFIEF